MKELLDFIEEQDKVLVQRSVNANVTERVLARTVKLGEEVGELCAEVLASQGDQRQEKLLAGGFTNETLAKEFADVVITTFILARSMGVDIPLALKKKIEILRQRNYENGR